MHLAVDAHNLLVDRRGIGVYLRAVVSRILKRAPSGTSDDVHVTLLVKDILPQRLRKALTTELCDNRSGELNRFAIANRIPRDADVVWHPWNGTFFESHNGRTASDIPTVVTIHDVVPFAFPSKDKRVRQSQQQPFLRSARATHVITDSEFSRNEIMHHLGIDDSRITVIPLAADERFTVANNDIPLRSFGSLAADSKSYILYVGANDARKNLETLTAAHRAAFPNGEIALVCVTRNAPIGAIELHDVSFEHLRELYQGARAFAMPSLYEGFGIPPLEAMRCGTPVVVSRAASLPEVCGDAALYVEEPLDVNAWTEALQRIVTDTSLRERLCELGSMQAQNFSWNQTAHKTLQFLKTIAATT
jgi:glycosyltransferase involved in cell wall biosynthesis